MEKKSRLQSYLLLLILLAVNVALFLLLFPSIKKSVLEIKKSLFPASIYQFLVATPLSDALPATPLVYDDGETTTLKNTLHASWSASSSGSPIVEYLYKIDATPGSGGHPDFDDIVGWTSAETNTSVTKTGLSLAYGTTYYFKVIAKDTAGLISDVGFSDGITPVKEGDSTPPEGSVIINGGNENCVSRSVDLLLSAEDYGFGMEGGMMKFSNDGVHYSQPVRYVNTYKWILGKGDGLKTVYVKFRDTAGNWTTEPAVDNIYLSETILSRPLKKYSLYYSSDPFPVEIIDLITQKFDLFVTSFGGGADKGIRQIKEINPNVATVGYRMISGMTSNSYVLDWPFVNMHEDWFLHDAEGHRLIHPKSGYYFMDISNVKWQEYFAESAKLSVDLFYPYYDGLFTDETASKIETWILESYYAEVKNENSYVASDGINVATAHPLWIRPPEGGRVDNKIEVYREGDATNYYCPDGHTCGTYSGNTITLPVPLPPGANVYVNYGARNYITNPEDPNYYGYMRPTKEKYESWPSDMMNMISLTKSKLGDNLLILNNGGTVEGHMDIADGIMLEGFVHAHWEEDSYSRDYAYWKKNFETLNAAAAKSKIFLSESSTKADSGDEAVVKNIMLNAYSSYLLGMDEDTYFYFENKLSSSSNFSGLTYYPEWDVNIGSPQGAHYIFSNAETMPDSGIILNPSFEQGTDYWWYHSTNSLVTVESIVDDIYKDGSHSLKVDVIGEMERPNPVYYGRYRSYTNIEKGKSYTLSGWIKTEGIELIPGYGGARIGIQYAIPDPSNPTELMYPTKFSERLSGTNDWTFVFAQIDIPLEAESVNIFFEITNSKSGTAWFDHLNIFEGEIEYYYARDFEKGKVLVNPYDIDFTISLDKPYQTLDGDIVNSVNLLPRTGIILLKTGSPSPQPPILTLPFSSTSGNEGELLEFTVTAQDPDTSLKKLSFRAFETSLGFLPSGAQLFLNSNGAATFSWIPDSRQAGSYTFRFNVTDDTGLSDNQEMQITVNNSSFLYGTVRDESGNPIEGAVVRVVRYDNSGLIEKITDGLGNFSFSEDLMNQYRFISEKTGYIMHHEVINVSTSADYSKEKTIVLKNLPVLAGMVSGPDGKGLAGVKITLSTGDYGISEGQWGTFYIYSDSVDSGRAYRITAEKEGYVTYISRAMTITIGSPSGPTLLNIRLEKVEGGSRREILPFGFIDKFLAMVSESEERYLRGKHKIITSAYSRGAGLIGPKTRANINEILHIVSSNTILWISFILFML